MKYRYLLSNQEFLYITYRNQEAKEEYWNKRIKGDFKTIDSKGGFDNPPKLKNEIEKKVNKWFGQIDDLKLIFSSNTLKPEFKEKLLKIEGFHNLLDFLVTYNQENPLLLENKKQEIANMMLRESLKYYQDRYDKTKFLLHKINEFESILDDIEELSKEYHKEENIRRFYQRNRQEMPTPIQTTSKEWCSVCMICWRSAKGKNGKEATTKIRHVADCPYQKNLKHCFKIVPPNTNERT